MVYCRYRASYLEAVASLQWSNPPYPLVIEGYISPDSMSRLNLFLEMLYWHKVTAVLSLKGKCIADVSKRLGLTLVVFSGLENVKKLTGGKLEVMNFDGKGQVEEYFREIGVPMTSVRLPCYYENLLTFFRPQKDKDGDGYTLVFPMGDVPLDGMSVKDLGVMVLRILESPSKYAGKDIGLSAEKLTTEQYASVMTRVLGKNIRDAKLSPDAFAKLDIPGAAELANMFRFYTMKPVRDVQATLQLNPKAKKFQCWLEENKAAFDDL